MKLFLSIVSICFLLKKKLLIPFQDGKGNDDKRGLKEISLSIVSRTMCHFDDRRGNENHFKTETTEHRQFKVRSGWDTLA